MFEEYQICPYTGLRSFTEEESLYFKGREEHIQQATEQLQRNKFLMLTGASGDGKSSLVYAGIVPNARAGFLKSKYTQWAVADFRPERSPFKNLCHALAKQLDIENPSIVESELHHGFSALVDLYKNSNRYIDVDAVAWQQADDKQKAALKRSAANLVIIVDQFEEFFTNPENYRLGAPSKDSNLVLNVLLETAKIALEENLPIYIVFTMRSDFIGQCAAFRSLPEYIGFSQFFVPRLNRTQLQQVIEEPAVLSGNRITRRLTERLIHDISEGVDQLPILQHALNQIWHAADQGKAEMDLIHYAMVGGMSVNELPDDQVKTFEQWYGKLSPEVKQFYREPNLQNVLDTHANKLYIAAVAQYRTKTGKQLTDETAKEVIRTTFICLTKIDQGRPVRNRMTLKEIHNIINRKDVDLETVGQLLNIFREPGNTFIRPFITDDRETEKLSGDAVLDITHESLIRNWEYLEQWAQQEFEHYNTYLDFEQQLKRWVDSGKSNGFLLSIGQLTYFENWYTTVKPNAWWIARYLTTEIGEEKKLSKGKQLLADAQDFLQRSASKHKITRTLMRYGPGRMAAVLAVLVLLVVGAFVVRNAIRKQNEYVVKDIRQEVLQLINSPKANILNVGALLVAALQDGVVSVEDIPLQAKDQLTAIRTSTVMAGNIIGQSCGEPPQDVLFNMLSTVDSLLNAYQLENNNIAINEGVFKEIVVHQHDLELGMLYTPSDKLDTFRKKNAMRCAGFVSYFLTQQPEGFMDVNMLHRGLEHAINTNSFTKEEIQKLIQILSPFENTNQSAWVLQRYQRDNMMKRGLFDYGFKFNGLYQELAYLYAAQGQTAKVLQAVDSLLAYNQAYYETSYTEVMDNASNIAGVFYTSGNTTQIDAFVAGYCLRKQMTATEFYERLLARSDPYIYISHNTDPVETEYSNGNLSYAALDLVSIFSEKLRTAILAATQNPDEKNFRLALSYKNEGLLKAHKLDLRNENSTEPFLLYDKAMAHYEKVSAEFLKLPISVNGAGTESSTETCSYLFTYPDMRPPFNSFEIRNTFFAVTSLSFINYIVSKNLLDQLYQSEADVASFKDYLPPLILEASNPVYAIRKRPAETSLVALEAAIRNSTVLKTADLNLLYLYIAQQAFLKDNKQDFLRLAANVNADNNFKFQYDPGYAFKMYAQVVTGLFHYNQSDSAYQLIKRFKNPINRSSLYAFTADQFLARNSNTEKVTALLDSAYAEMARVRPEDLTYGQPNRILLAYGLALQNDEAKLREAYKMIKNIQYKAGSIQLIGFAFAGKGELYKAFQSIPADASDNDKIISLIMILVGYQGGEAQPAWTNYNSHYPWATLNFINYVNE